MILMHLSTNIIIGGLKSKSTLPHSDNCCCTAYGETVRNVLLVAISQSMSSQQAFLSQLPQVKIKIKVKALFDMGSGRSLTHMAVIQMDLNLSGCLFKQVS